MSGSETDSPEVLAREALMLERQGRLEPAIAVYRDQLSRRPELADCWYARALLGRRTRVSQRVPMGTA